MWSVLEYCGSASTCPEPGTSPGETVIETGEMLDGAWTKSNCVTVWTV